MTNDLEINFKLSHASKTEMARRIECIKNQIVYEFPRKIKSIFHYDKYKASEYRFLLLYAGPIIFKNILKVNHYKHFIFLHVACRLLSDQRDAINNVEIARELLKNFVEEAHTIYGTKFLVLNTHNLIHIVDDVKNMNCCLNFIDAFCFENHLGKIKNLLHSPNNILAQYCRRLHEIKHVIGTKVTDVPVLQILKRS